MTADFAVLCTGPSMSQAFADAVRGLTVIVVNKAVDLAPWAQGLVANDTEWWRQNPQAKEFAGRKFSTSCIPGVERVTRHGCIQSGTCSGVLALEVAVQFFEGRRGLLLGADLHGDHYFGRYPDTLKNTSAERRRIHARQFAMWKKSRPGIEIINCSPGSQLDCFPRGVLEEVLC